MFRESSKGQTHSYGDGCSDFHGKAHPLEWFIERVGKKIARLTDTKCCPSCQDVLKNGLIVHDEQHARYLEECQNEMGLEYSDVKV